MERCIKVLRVLPEGSALNGKPVSPHVSQLPRLRKHGRSRGVKYVKCGEQGEKWRNAICGHNMALHIHNFTKAVDICTKLARIQA